MVWIEEEEESIATMRDDECEIDHPLPAAKSFNY
jgi:hypothetical protein